jgi:hypothetical protein
MSSPGRPWGLRDAAVRRCLLAVMVLHDLDVSWDEGSRPSGAGLADVRLEGTSPVRVSGDRLRALVGSDDPEDSATIDRVARWLLLRRAVHELPMPLLREGLRVVGLPVGHLLHPGEQWVEVRVAGGALTLGLGLLPAASDADPQAPTPVPLPPGVLQDAGIDPSTVWPDALRRLEELGSLAAARRRRRPRDPLRPLAEADVVTLLGSRAFRAELAGGPDSRPAGLAGLVVPMRTRGWVSSSAIDPAFGPAAAAATDEQSRGFPRPLLVTEDEVVQVPEGGHALRYLGHHGPRPSFS